MNHLPIPLGTSSFTATGWEGVFYPKGMRSADYLAFYAEHFHTVEVDSTFYGCPSARTVNNWATRTPEGFVFSVKVPQAITHEKALMAVGGVIASLWCRPKLLKISTMLVGVASTIMCAVNILAPY